MIFYGIRNIKTKEPLGFSSQSNDNAENCVSITCTLEEKYSSNVWLITRKQNAINTLNTNTEWYNADYESPQHPSKFDPKEYEVFEVNI